MSFSLDNDSEAAFEATTGAPLAMGHQSPTLLLAEVNAASGSFDVRTVALVESDGKWIGLEKSVHP